MPGGRPYQTLSAPFVLIHCPTCGHGQMTKLNELFLCLQCILNKAEATIH
jgi:hypothetical protein